MNSADLKPLLIDLEDCDKSTGRKQSKDVQRERLSEGDIYCVYWIKKEDHTDIHTEGYVGITKDFEERMRSHRKNKRKSHLTSAIKKYSWENLIVNKISNKLSLEEALRMEKELRPKEYIGWNSQRGGYLGVNPEWYENLKNKKEHSRRTSEATKIAIAEKDTTEARSARAKKNWEENRESYKDIAKGSRNPNSKLNETQVWEIKYKWIPEGFNNKEIASIYDVSPHSISFIRVGRTWRYV